MRLTRRAKYGNRKVIIDGYKFDSVKEGARYQCLKLFQVAGQIRNLKVHPRFELDVNGELITIYTADFQYESIGGLRPVVEDVKALNLKKGKPIVSEASNLRHKLFKALFPEYDFQIYA